VSQREIRLSPYLILGVDIGATAAEANRAFARRVKQVKSGEIELSQEDLNWAQSQFRRPEELVGSLDYLRVPTGSATRPQAPEGTLFRPGPVPLSRRTESLDPEEWERLALEVMRAALIEVVRSFDVIAPSPYGEFPGGVTPNTREGEDT